MVFTNFCQKKSCVPLFFVYFFYLIFIFSNETIFVLCCFKTASVIIFYILRNYSEPHLGF